MELQPSQRKGSKYSKHKYTIFFAHIFIIVKKKNNNNKSAEHLLMEIK